MKGNDSTTWKLRLEAWSDRFRVLKVARFAYKKYVTGDSREGQPSGSDMMAGQPEYTNYPPEEWKWKLGMQNRDALLAGWQQDVHNIAIRSKKMNSKMILMNYHLNAPFMNTKAVQEMAQKEGVPFLNNEELWQKEAVATNRTKQLLMHDGWHPNPEGYGLIAGNVFQLIRRQDLLGLE